jgi:hypothetical protein
MSAASIFFTFLQDFPDIRHRRTNCHRGTTEAVKPDKLALIKLARVTCPHALPARPRPTMHVTAMAKQINNLKLCALYYYLFRYLKAAAAVALQRPMP